MSLLREYFDGWRHGDVEAVLSTLADGCVVVDQDGVLLRGREQVAAKMRQWMADGGVVHDLTISAETVEDDVLTAQWVLDASWQGVRATVEGRSMAHVRDGEISYLRGYSGVSLGDWDGTWQS